VRSTYDKNAATVTTTHSQLNKATTLVSKVYVDLYSAFLRKAPQMRSDMDHAVLPANYTMPAFTPQPQNITALWLVLILPSHGGWKAESTWVVGYIPK